MAILILERNNMAYALMIKNKEKILINESEYKMEKNLHDLLEETPELVNIPGVEEGDLILPIAKEYKASDLLCVDNNGSLILIEVKLDNNQTMRDIVAQILDYASKIHKTGYQEFNQGIREYLLKKYQSQDVADVFYNQFKDKIDLTNYDNDESNWKSDFIANIQNNLTLGKFRFVIYANKIPEDIKRVCNYLSEVHRMEIYCIEADYFQKGDIKILIPKRFDFGKPQSTEVQSSSRPGNIDIFNEYLEANTDPGIKDKIRNLCEFTLDKADLQAWGRGQMPNFTFRVKYTNKDYITLFQLWADGKIDLWTWLKEGLKKPEFQKYSKDIDDYLKKIQKLANVKDFKSTNKFNIKKLDTQEKLENFKQIVLQFKQILH